MGAWGRILGHIAAGKQNTAMNRNSNSKTSKRQDFSPADIHEARITGIGIVDGQNGGHGRFAHVTITMHSAENPNDPNIVRSAVVGGAIPTAFLAAAISGCEEGLKRGPIGGYPVTGVIVTLTDGKAHPVDSDAGSFAEAGRLAVQNALQQASVVLLEPIARLEVVVDAEHLGATLGDLARRRGQVLETIGGGSQVTVHVAVPLAETFGYATALRSLTKGQGIFTLEPNGYAEAPASA